MDLNKNYYQILGVEKTAADEDIKKTFRKLALQFHPDKNNSKEAEDKFKNINDAYQVLGDIEKKNQYDNQSPHGKTYKPFSNPQGFNPFSGFNRSGNPFNDMYDEIFKNFGATFGNFGFAGQQRNSEHFNEKLDINMLINVSFSDVYCNKPIPVSYQRYISCDRCNGSGFDPDGETFMCEMCDGTGYSSGIKCEHCDGTGNIHTGTCKKCNGEKLQIKRESFNFQNSYQITQSFKTRKQGYGNQSKYYRSKRGDLIVTIQYENNTNFKVVPRGLEYVLDLHYEDAIKGKNIKIKLPDNKEYDVKIPKRTKDRDNLRLQNMGTFTFDGKTRTDLYIIINIIIDYNRDELPLN